MKMTKLKMAETLGLDIPPDDEEEIEKRKKAELEAQGKQHEQGTRRRVVEVFLISHGCFFFF
jgi:hypothetical protein